MQVEHSQAGNRQDAYFIPGDQRLPLWLCFVVVGAFAAFGIWFALHFFNRAVR